MNKNTVSQWSILRNDKWLLSSLTWIPVMVAVAIWWIFSQGMARELPVAVVDLQHSTLSRQLIRNIDATSTLQVNAYYEDVLQAKNALVANDIYAYIIIPKHFERDIYLGMPPQVSVFYNSQFILIGKLINSAIIQAHTTFNVQVGAAKQLAEGNTTLQSALAKSLTIQTQITPLFNKNSNYTQFLVSGIIPAIWQISIVASSVLLLAANYRVYGLTVLFKEQPILSRLLSIFSVYLPFFIVQGGVFLFCFYVVFDWSISGSIFTLLVAQFLTIIACIIMGCFFFFLSLDPARAMSMAGAFTAPSFAFMGVTFPVADMNLWAQGWRALLPVTHYIEAQISQMSYGLSRWETLGDLTPPLLGYLLPLLLVVVLIKKHLSKLSV